MTRRDWWLGIALVVAALVLHAVFPRYEVTPLATGGAMRVDRWTGKIMPRAFGRAPAATGQFRPEDVDPAR